jgi:signal transduction histidine kinase
LAALVKVQQQLLALGNDDTFYNGILAPLGQAANANRVYVFQNEVDATARRIAAWYAPEINPHCAKSLPQHLSYEAQLPRWATTLSQKKIIVGNVESFPEPEQKFLAVQNIQSILILPLIVNGQFFGFIGFDQCVEVRTWEPAEIDLLQAAAAGISLWQERRQAEAKLHQYTTQLKAHNAELDAFAHTVAHDLKNPLTALTGVAEILATTHMSSEVLNEYLGAIVRGGRKALSIVEELLVLASVRQQEDIALERLEMGAIVAETQERLRYMISEAEAQIILPKTWPVALGYAPWIEEIWANYLSNALKYGGQPPLITLGATIQSNGQIRFWVHDNGLGLAEAEQGQLFTRFTQLKQTRAKGHGLGLSIVRRIATKLGGEVGVESQSVPGQGSTFYFTLPRAEGKGED